MWTVVYIAQTEQIARTLQKNLETEGMLVNVRPISKKEPDGKDYYEELVLESEKEEAQNVIIENGY